MARTDEERENICQKYEGETHDLLDEWIGYEDDDAQSLTLAEKCQKAAQLLPNISGIDDDEVDGPMKDLKRMFGNCFGKQKKKDITLNHPSA